jgi:hypothetical protein
MWQFIYGPALALLGCLSMPGAFFGQAVASEEPARPSSQGSAKNSPSILPDPLRLGEVRPYPEMNALFQRRDGWIGADGAHSVALTAERTLWLFSDTWVGSIRGGKRTDATIVNNTVVIQEGRGADASMQFVVRRDSHNKPTAFLTPTEGRGWFWLQAGAHVNQRLFLFLSQVEKTDRPGVFGFRQIGQWLGTVANPLDGPAVWRTEQRKLPCTIFTAERELTFGAALLEDQGYLYIYGTDEAVRPSGRDRYLIVARVRTTEVENFAGWQFYREGQWVTDFRTASRLVPKMASDGSVSYLPKLKQYVLVYTEGGMSARILARSALMPWGPWSAPRLVYECPETGWDKKIFCYCAKAHPALAGPAELVISYSSNSFDFWQVAADARIYWPHFVRAAIQPK